MSNTERLPTVLYRTPAASSTPLSAGSHYTPSAAGVHTHATYRGGYGSPASPGVFSPVSTSSNLRNGALGGAGAQYSGGYGHRTPQTAATPPLGLRSTGAGGTYSSSSYLGTRANATGLEDKGSAHNSGVQAVPRQLYGSGNTAPPPVMSLRSGGSLPDTPGGAKGGGHGGRTPSTGGPAAANRGPRDPNPLLANEYAFGSAMAPPRGEATTATSAATSFRSRWVTVYGFQQSDRDLILRELQVRSTSSSTAGRTATPFAIAISRHNWT